MRRPPDVAELAPGLLVGGAPDARAIAELVRRGVSHVLDLRVVDEGAFIAWPAAVTVRSLPAPEGSALADDQLAEVAAWICEVRASGGAVLVHCRAGAGRSVMVALAALVADGMRLGQAWELATRMRPIAALTTAQVDALRRYATRA